MSVTNLYQVQSFAKPPKNFSEWVKAICIEMDMKNAKKWKVGVWPRDTRDTGGHTTAEIAT